MLLQEIHTTSLTGDDAWFVFRDRYTTIELRTTIAEVAVQMAEISSLLGAETGKEFRLHLVRKLPDTTWWIRRATVAGVVILYDRPVMETHRNKLLNLCLQHLEETINKLKKLI